MLFHTKKIYSLILATLTLTSCHKEKLICSASCTPIILAGRIIDKSNNKPISGQTIETTVAKNGLCLFCKTYTLGSSKSNSDGRFTISTNIDSSIFDTQHIILLLKNPPGFITAPEPVGPGIANSILYSNASFYSIDNQAMGNLSFEFYQKALLTINLHRKTPVSTQRNITLDFTFDDKTSGWGIIESEARTDTSLTINTSTNLYTKISAYKTDAANIITKTTDSIRCLANTANTININY